MRTTMKTTVSMMLCLVMVLGMLTVVQGADIKLPDLIGDHMLIQQAEPIKLWGTAPAGETITITLGTETKIVSKGETVAEADGSFRAELPATMAGGPYTLTFSTPSSTEVVEDVLVGELWVQCGQSMMATTTSSTGDHAQEILPKQTMNEIRLFINTEKPSDADRQKYGTKRQTDLDGRWKVATKSNVMTYSGLGYSALQKIYEEINMPVGGICCAVGGMAMSYYQVPPENYNDLPGSSLKDQFIYGSLYNIKVSPLTQMNIRGVIWQQGTADRTNANFGPDFKKLITDWRTEWNDEDMPFVFAGCFPSPMKYPASWVDDGYIMEDFSITRLGHFQAYNELENTAYAISIDCKPIVGVDTDPLHPRTRKPAGERLGLGALGMIYGLEDRWSSPFYQKATVTGNTAVITFSHAYDGLETTDGQDPRCFMVAGADGKFYEASAEITGTNQVTITCPEVTEIKTISYALEKRLFPYKDRNINYGDWVIDTYADINLVNSEGLPAGPFEFEVSKVLVEKEPKFKAAESLDFVAALGDTYSLPKTVKISENGVVSEKNVTWSVSSINTKKTGKTTLYGLAEGVDLILPATVTVQQVDDHPIQSASVIKNDGNANVSVVLDNIQAGRCIYVMTAFYKEDGSYLGAQVQPEALTAGQTGTLTMTAPIPTDAKKVKVMVVNQNLRPYTSVIETDL